MTEVSKVGTLTITDFLWARITEDEQVAREASHSTGWRYDPGKVNAVSREESVFAGPPGARAITIASTGPEDDPQSMMDARHIARFDPARVLAGCKAKREIVEECERSILNDKDPSTAEWIAAHLAAVYASHPDYNQDWAPES